MRGFVAEWYSPVLTTRDRGERTARLRRAALDVSRSGSNVAVLGSLDVPADETCLCLFRSESRKSVEAALHAAGMTWDRTVKAVLGGMQAPQGARSDREVWRDVTGDFCESPFPADLSKGGER